MQRTAVMEDKKNRCEHEGKHSSVSQNLFRFLDLVKHET